MNLKTYLMPVQQATIAARQRCGGKYAIATRTENGLLQVVVCTYDHKGKDHITPLSDWVQIDEIPALLNALTMAKVDGATHAIRVKHHEARIAAMSKEEKDACIDECELMMQKYREEECASPDELRRMR